MSISAINSTNNYSPSFGHSFRVSICLKNAYNGQNVFINPASDSKLYKKLNSKIVSWLNEEFFNNIRNLYSINRKVAKTQPQNLLHKSMIENLKNIDKDYKNFNFVRSIYRRNKLGYIVTGIDVPIIENMKGLKNIGIAKADAAWTYGRTNTPYVKNLSAITRENALKYISNDSILLRSNDDKEIMLKAIFKEIGLNKKKEPIYELDSFEFHKIKTKPDLKPVNENIKIYKQSSFAHDLIGETIKHLIKNMKKQ